MDRATATRHVMQANRSRDTGPELQVRAALREAGLPGYRLQWKKAAGRPDICYPGRHVAIFVNGCYWHRCPLCALPTPRTNTAFWEEKFARNQARDQRNYAELTDAGWRVLVVWECQLRRGRAERTLGLLASEVGREVTGGELVQVGAPSGWRLRAMRGRLRRR